MLLNKSYVQQAVGTQDYIALQYYSADMVSFNPLRPMQLFSSREYPRDIELSETGFIANIPQGMVQALHWARHFRLPIYITENGVEDSQDTMRPSYLLDHLRQVRRALSHGCDIRGYFHWSQVDNFEWERGWSQRFGLWGLEVDTQRRVRRPSADLYAAICRENGISRRAVKRWAPHMIEKLFPD
jgi:beta-glucosidase